MCTPYGLYLWSFMLLGVPLHNFSYNEKHLNCHILPLSLARALSYSNGKVSLFCLQSSSMMHNTVTLTMPLHSCSHLITWVVWVGRCLWLLSRTVCSCVYECVEGSVYVWYLFSSGFQLRPHRAPSSWAQPPADKGQSSPHHETLHTQPCYHRRTDS